MEVSSLDTGIRQYDVVSPCRRVVVCILCVLCGKSIM